MNTPEVEFAFPECVRVESKPHLFCPGCGHPEVLKAFGFAVDDLGIQRKTAFGVDIGCSLLAFDFFNIDTIETHHGRTVPVMVGIKRANPNAVSVAYVGDGGAYAIGLGSLVNAAIRDEKIFVIVVNNAVYGMTGGQKAPTTLPGTITPTTPYGADNHFIKGPQLLRNVNPSAWIARGITTRQLELRKLMREALEFNMAGKGFAFLEVLSPCTLGWETVEKPNETFDILEHKLAKVYKLEGIDMQPYKIVIAGEGGQGVQSIAKIIAQSAFDQGKKAMYVPYFSTEKRGGTTEVYAQVGDTVPAYPKFAKADLWVVLSQRAIERIYTYLRDDTKVIVNSFLVKDLSKITKWHPIEINAGKITSEQLKKPGVFNMIIMGAMVKLIPGLDRAKFLDAVRKQFTSAYAKEPSLEALNAKAFDMGYELA